MKKRFLLLLIVPIFLTLCCRQTGQDSIPPDQVKTPTSTELFPFTKNGKQGFIYATGQVMIEPKFDGVGPFAEGIAPFRQDILWGYINQTGEIVIPAEFGWVSSFSEGLGCVSLNGRWGFIDKNGKFVISPQYSHASSFSEGLAAALSYDNGVGKQVYIDKTGKVVLDLGDRFRGDEKFSEGLLLFADGNERFGYVDKSGSVVIPARFQGAEDFREGLAAVRINDKVGYIDKTGQMIIAPQFKTAGEFSEGLAMVQPGGWLNFSGHRLGYIDKFGKWAIPVSFDYASPFSHGLASVIVDGKEGIINKDGNYVWIEK